MSGDPALVHGLADDLVLPDWPPLTLDEVTPVLCAYGLTAMAVTWQSPRPLSAAGLVVADSRTVFVKRQSARVRSARGLLEEHAFSEHLRAHGVKLPELVRARDGSTVVETEGWMWEVQERGEGNDLYRETQSWQPFFSVTHAHSAGATLARLATAGEQFTAPAREPQPLITSWGAIAQPDLVGALEEFVAARPMLAGALSGRPWQKDVTRDVVPLHRRFAPYAELLPPGWTHGDAHASNFLWDPAGAVSCVLDLGLSDRTTPLVELATAIERNAVSWLDPRPQPRLDVVDALLRGWSSVRPLSDVEAAALPELVPIVHTEFALSEVGYYADVTGSADNAEIAYSTYLLGHARWHAGPEGQELRQHLQTYAGWTPGR